MKQLLADRVRGGDVALDFAQRAPLLDGFSDWDWRLESDGASRDADHVRLVSAQVGDPVAIVPPPTLAAPAPAGCPRAGRTAVVKSILPSIKR